MLVLRVERRHDCMRGVFAEVHGIIWEHHPSGLGWGHLPDMYRASSGRAGRGHVCACRDMREFYTWWPRIVLSKLAQCDTLRVVLLHVPDYVGVHYFGCKQAVVQRDACEVLLEFSIGEFLSLSEHLLDSLFIKGEQYATEQNWAASTAYDYREEPRFDSQRFARESRRVAAKMREHVQAQYTCKVSEYGGGGLTFPKGV